MVIYGQNKIPIDNNYGLSKECLSFITLISKQNLEIKDTNSYAMASKICRMTITVSGKNCISGFVYYLWRANNQRNFSNMTNIERRKARDHGNYQTDQHMFASILLHIAEKKTITFGTLW